MEVPLEKRATSSLLRSIHFSSMRKIFFIWQAIVRTPSISMDGFFLNAASPIGLSLRPFALFRSGKNKTPKKLVDNTPANSALRNEYGNRYLLDSRANIRLCAQERIKN